MPNESFIWNIRYWEFYQLSEVKAVADRVIVNNKDGIRGYYITKQEILEINM